MSKKDFSKKIRKSLEILPEPEIEAKEALERKIIEGTKRIKNARYIPIEKIRPDPDQPRRTISEERLQELAQSIKEHGLLQPISVEYIKDQGYYKIISGERRYRACKLIGLESIPCLIKEGVTGERRYAQQLIENIQREDLSPIEKAMALLEYKEKLGKSWPEIEKMIGLSETRRKQFIALLNLPERIQKEVVSLGRRPAKNIITEKHARALLMLNKLPEKQTELFNLIKNSLDSISGDEAIEIAKEMRGSTPKHVFKIVYQTEEELLERLQRAIEEIKLKIKNRGSPR